MSASGQLQNNSVNGAILIKINRVIIKLTFSFPEFVSACKKSAQFISSLRQCSFLIMPTQ